MPSTRATRRQARRADNARGHRTWSIPVAILALIVMVAFGYASATGKSTPPSKNTTSSNSLAGSTLYEVDLIGGLTSARLRQLGFDVVSEQKATPATPRALATIRAGLAGEKRLRELGYTVRPTVQQ